MNREDFAGFGGSLTADVLTFNPNAIPAPDTLIIRMTRGEHRITDEMRKAFGSFERVVIDVDGEQHEFSADSLLQMLEDYEDAQGMNNHMRLFGTPERAARALALQCFGATSETCDTCVFGECDGKLRNSGAYPTVYDTLLEWLEGEAE